jgi:hypothetical protein
MTVLELALLRGGFTPEELGLPDSVLDGAGNQPLSLRADLPQLPKQKQVPHDSTQRPSGQNR